MYLSPPPCLGSYTDLDLRIRKLSYSLNRKEVESHTHPACHTFIYPGSDQLSYLYFIVLFIIILKSCFYHMNEFSITSYHNPAPAIKTGFIVSPEQTGVNLLTPVQPVYQRLSENENNRPCLLFQADTH